MTVTIKVLGQLAAAATTEGDIYTCPTDKDAIVNTITVCNRGASATTFRLSVSVAGGATASKDYLYYDEPLPGNRTFVCTMGVTMAETDVLRGYAGSANVSFNAFGRQADPA